MNGRRLDRRVISLYLSAPWRGGTYFSVAEETPFVESADGTGI